MEIVNLFTTPLCSKSLVLDNDLILSYCYSLRNKDQGRTVSNRGGWQSNDITDVTYPLVDLLNGIIEFSSEICNVLGLYPLEIKNCWVNINGYKDCNWPHTHGGAILSGVYYVKTPKDCGHIEFQNTSAELMPVNLQITDFNEFNSENRVLPSEEGKLYIFPSWLKHGVNPNLNRYEERVSISFNLVHQNK